MTDAADRSYPRTGAPLGAPRADRSVRVLGCALTSRAIGAVDRVAVAGELTMATVGLLDAEVAHLCRRERDRIDLVLDLTGITFLDVMGLAALRRVQERVTARGGIRLGLPVTDGPSRLIRVAVEHSWLAPEFEPGTLTL